MTETTDRAALIAEAAGYDGYCYFCGDLMPNLAAALAAAEIELAVARAIVNEAIRGDRERYQKIDEQAAIIQAVREWCSTTLWAQPDWPSLTAILDA